MNFKSLARVLKYTLASKEDFQRAIEANPSDYTTHFAYADWLREHEEPEEADFRERMGKWHQDGHHKTDEHPLPHNIQILPHADRTILPDGVDMMNMPYRSSIAAGVRHQPVNLALRINDHTDYPFPVDSEVPHFFILGADHQTFRWPTYAAMEGAFRNAFIASRNKERRLGK